MYLSFFYFLISLDGLASQRKYIWKRLWPVAANLFATLFFQTTPLSRTTRKFEGPKICSPLAAALPGETSRFKYFRRRVKFVGFFARRSPEQTRQEPGKRANWGTVARFPHGQPLNPFLLRKTFSVSFFSAYLRERWGSTFGIWKETCVCSFKHLFMRLRLFCTLIRGPL